MSRNKIDIATLAEMATAISHYGCLANCFSQLDPAQRATLEPAWKKACSGSKDGKYMDYQSNAIWQDINFHLVKQMWGSTACGWGGMGGSAMTQSFTTIIENAENALAFVYYGGTLAYVAEWDTKWETFMHKGYHGLPDMDSCKSRLTIVYINTNRR